MNAGTVVLIAVVPVAMACAGGAAEEVERGDRATPVRVARVEADTVAEAVQATGVVAPRDEVTLSFKVGGVVREVSVDPGDEVRAGQRLAVLELPEIDAGVAQARASAEKTERDAARAERLHADGAISLAELQDARTAAAIARAELERASFNRRFAEVVAPSAGVVLRRTAEPGELMSAGVPVIVLAAGGRGSVLRVGVADRDVVRLDVGDKARVRIDALPGVEHTGTVVEIGAAAQSSTGTYLVEIALPRAEGLVTGLVGTATIDPADRRPVLFVPLTALVEADGNAGAVFVMDGMGRAERRAVTLGAMQGARIALASGVSAGDMVVTDGAAYLDDGAAVEVVTDGAVLRDDGGEAEAVRGAAHRDDSEVVR